MNKAQELEILDVTIKTLGKESYCGPWLATVRDEVEREIRGDYFPDFSIRAARTECERMKVETTAFCDKQCEVAKDYATQIRVEARAAADKIAITRGALHKELLQAAQRELNRIIENLP